MRSLAIAAVLAHGLYGQTTVLSWEQIKARFLMQNPSVLAGQINIEESKANEITAGLRPNPQFNLSQDGLQLTPSAGVWRPLTGIVFTPGVSQLIERQNKREKRVDSARLATSGASSDQEDLQRTLLFAVRTAFLNTLQAKALVELDASQSSILRPGDRGKSHPLSGRRHLRIGFPARRNPAGPI